MRKILAAVDESESSIKVVRRAVDLARHYDSKLTLVTVVEEYEIRRLGGYLLDPEPKLIKEQWEERAQKLLDKLAQQPVPSEFPVERKVLTGTPDTAIVEEAAAGNYDLIVIGRRGMSKLDRFFIGSVTHRVLSKTPCGVFIVHEGHEEQE